MIVLIFIFSICNALFFIALRIQWDSINAVTLDTEDGSLPIVCVIIAVRNESKNIKNLLSDLKNQHYPSSLIEIIVVNDHSADDTKEVVTSFGLINLEWMDLRAGEEGKKKAITVGVNKAMGAYVLCTDGDCRVKPNWIRAMISPMLKGKKMVTGPVQFSGRGFFADLQSMEFIGLIGFGAATLEMGYPSMCNGANIGYDRKVFFEVDGYSGNEHIPTGDDEFLLQKVNARYPGSASFVKTTEAIVSTKPKETVHEFISQRIRWVSKWRFHKSRFVKLSAILAFLDFMLAMSLPGLLFGAHTWVSILLLLARVLGTFSYLHGISNFFGQRLDFFNMVILVIFYPYYSFVLGFASIFGKYSWKGRSYRNDGQGI
ncbi:MAG: glycosyltransferase [Cyclobacteriaceae bacterium]